MAYFKERSTKKVNLPSNADYWVEIVTDFKYGELKNFANAGDTENIDFQMTADKLLASAIVSWNLDDGEGNIAEVNQANIDQLSKDDALALINAISDAAVVDEKIKKN